MKKPCLQCGAEFHCKPSHFNKKSYCSRACMATHYAVRFSGASNPNFRDTNHHCEACGAVFTRYDSRARFCSRRCWGLSAEMLERLKRIAARPKRPRKQTVRFVPVFVCVGCKQQSYGKGRKYCRACSPIKSALRPCVVCGSEANRSRTCSMKCRSRLSAIQQAGALSHRWLGGKTNDATRLRNSLDYSLWRRRVFERDNYTCAVCRQRGGRLAAHHIKPFAQYPELRLEPSNGITLCWPCHGKLRGIELEYSQPLAWLAQAAAAKGAQ